MSTFCWCVMPSFDKSDLMRHMTANLSETVLERVEGIVTARLEAYTSNVTQILRQEIHAVVDNVLK